MRQAEAGLSDLHTGKQVSSRHSALRAGNRAGLVAGIGLRGRSRQLFTGVTKRAYASIYGRSGGPHPVPERWRTLFVRAFLKAAEFAAHSNHNITAHGKYGAA